MNKILIVIDMQNDFVDGALGTPEAQAIVQNVVRKIDSWDGPVVYTRDTHEETYSETQEGRKLPVPHCIAGTPGWELCAPVADALTRKNAVGFRKPAFGSVDLAEYIADRYLLSECDGVQLVGLCTDICVVSNALMIKAFCPELPVTADASCCAGVTPESHREALDVMRMCQVGIEGEQA